MYEKVYLVLFWVFLVISLIWSTINIINVFRYEYEYNNNYYSYWSLADKSSTIAEKSKYINMFVDAFEKSNFQGQYNAIFFKTPDVSFNKNLEALKSLQKRLQEIQMMDIKSFEYQMAIQQITQQEQGEAKAMLDVLKGVWMKNNYFLYWTWVGIINWFILIAVIFCTVIFRMLYNDNI